jgi:hypothetical protein
MMELGSATNSDTVGAAGLILADGSLTPVPPPVGVGATGVDAIGVFFPHPAVNVNAAIAARRRIRFLDIYFHSDAKRGE